MATVPIHAAVATPSEYSLAFATTGAPAVVNASDMQVEVESSHWFVSVAPHELVASGLRYVVSYAQLNELMWCVAECDTDLRSVRFVQVAVGLAWVQDLLQACLNAGLPRSPLRTWSAVCAVLCRCAQSLAGAAAATRRLRAGDLHKLQTLGGRGTHVFSGAAADPSRAAWLEALEVGGVVAMCKGSARVLALLERLLAPGAGRWQLAGRDDSAGDCAATATRILRTAGAVTNNPQIAVDTPASQAAEVVIFLSTTFPVAPMMPNPAPTAAAVMQYVVNRNRTSADRFVLDFDDAWATYTAFGTLLYDASDADARQYLTAWLSMQDASALLSEVPVSGLHAKVMRMLPAVAALGPSASLAQRAAEVCKSPVCWGLFLERQLELTPPPHR
ncbi:hypothetical protein AB1Y20_004317 [Prymnesium parvum]|uniref:Uncharacterized protein n=1 Tax=Prymnesium parvum TaxID=97485 RepID=A0AB34IYJ7_PRYPA